VGLSGPLFFPRCLRLFEAPESPKDGRTKGPREQRTREQGPERGQEGPERDQRGTREGPERDQRGTREGPERDQRGTRGRKDQRNDREIHKPQDLKRAKTLHQRRKYEYVIGDPLSILL